MNLTRVKIFTGFGVGCVFGFGMGWLTTIITQKKLLYYFEYYCPSKFNPCVHNHNNYNYGYSKLSDPLYIKHCKENKAYYDRLRSKIQSSEIRGE